MPKTRMARLIKGRTSCGMLGTEYRDAFCPALKHCNTLKLRISRRIAFGVPDGS